MICSFVDGHCSECGECCGRILPICLSDIKRIRKFLKKHDINPVITEEKDMHCPFLDKSKQTHRCMIYEARPNICRYFSCNKPLEKAKASNFIMACEPYDMVKVWENNRRKKKR